METENNRRVQLFGHSTIRDGNFPLDFKCHIFSSGLQLYNPPRKASFGDFAVFRAIPAKFGVAAASFCVIFISLGLDFLRPALYSIDWESGNTRMFSGSRITIYEGGP
jgi:hypothetical protein